MTLDTSLITGPVFLLACMLGVFVATVTLVLVLTTPYETPAMRLARYARYTRRATSPGAISEDLSMRDRLIMPVLRRLVEFAARAAPSRARQAVTAELVMAGSRMNPTV